MKRDKILEAYERSILKEAKNIEDEYESKRKAIKILIKSIEKKLDNHSKKFKKEGSINWGFVGDVGRIAQDLKEINDYMMM
jgi:hypothetical protein